MSDATLNLDLNDIGRSDGRGALRRSAIWRPQPRFVHEITTTLQLDAVNDAGGIAVQFEPTPKGAVHLAFEGSQSETLSIWTTRAHHGFISRPKLAADLITIRFVRTGFMLRDDKRGEGTVVGFDQAMCASFGEMHHEQASAGFSATTASIGRDAVERACRTLSGSESVLLPRFLSVVDANSPGLAALRQTLAVLQDQLVRRIDNDLTVPLLQELLVYQFVSAWPSSGGSMTPKPADISVRPIKLALDFIEANLRRAIRISDIAHAAGLNARALQTGFRRHVGCSPVQYLISRRLDRVHAALQLESDLSIQDIATIWGFTHMSDFGRRYRQRFGRSPRDTVKPIRQ